MFDATIVGAGPAGSSCALWLKQLGFSPVIIDRNDQCGGLQLLNPYLNTWIATSTDSL
jgi:thioredoxin reductase (NADPH)